MRHKFLGIGEPGYHPLRKLATVASGLRYAVLYDGSVTCKVILSPSSSLPPSASPCSPGWW